MAHASARWAQPAYSLRDASTTSDAKHAQRVLSWPSRVGPATCRGNCPEGHHTDPPARRGRQLQGQVGQTDPLSWRVQQGCAAAQGGRLPRILHSVEMPLLPLPQAARTPSSPGCSSRQAGTHPPPWSSARCRACRPPARRPPPPPAAAPAARACAAVAPPPAPPAPPPPAPPPGPPAAWGGRRRRRTRPPPRPPAGRSAAIQAGVRGRVCVGKGVYKGAGECLGMEVGLLAALVCCCRPALPLVWQGQAAFIGHMPCSPPSRDGGWRMHLCCAPSCWLLPNAATPALRILPCALHRPLQNA